MNEHMFRVKVSGDQISSKSTFEIGSFDSSMICVFGSHPKLPVASTQITWSSLCLPSPRLSTMVPGLTTPVGPEKLATLASGIWAMVTHWDVVISSSLNTNSMLNRFRLKLLKALFLWLFWCWANFSKKAAPPASSPSTWWWSKHEPQNCLTLHFLFFTVGVNCN